MRMRLFALALATLDAVILFVIRQAQTVDTSVWIALIAGVVGLLTLIIQTYGQMQLAKIKTMQEQQGKAVDKQTDKIADQSARLAEVHTTVNSGRDKMIEKLEKLVEEVNLLKGAAVERDKSDAKEQNRLIGANQERLSASVPPAPQAAALGSTDAKPMHVEVVNPEPLPVVVKTTEAETKPDSKP